MSRSGTVEYDGGQRPYQLFLPGGAIGNRQPVPVVLAFHGTGGDPAQMRQRTALDALAQERRFIVVYPKAVDGTWAPRPEVDDLGFVSALLRTVNGQYAVDATRVYAVGFSSGALFAQRLACEQADKLAAVALVAGAVPVELDETCAPARPLSVLFVSGTADPFLPFEGGAATGDVAAAGEVLGAEAGATSWAQRVGCQSSPARRELPDTAGDGTLHTVMSWTGCEGGTGVELHTVRGGGHTWPGAPPATNNQSHGVTSHQFAASEVVWDFFFAHVSPGD